MLDLAQLEKIISTTPHWLQDNPDFQKLADTLRSALAPEDTAPPPASAEEPLVAYCDGSSLGNPGPAGWAVVYVNRDGNTERFSKPLPEHATNQAAEITAATQAILNAPSYAPLVIRTDSQYIVGTMNENWRRNANRERWAELDAAIAGHGAPVAFEWVKGHDNDPLNKKADKLARAAADRAIATA